jgi:hypothetical protein
MNILTIDKIAVGFVIALGIWLTSKYFWMCVYQFKYGGNYGERYIKNQISKEEKQELKQGVKSYPINQIKELKRYGGFKNER